MRQNPPFVNLVTGAVVDVMCVRPLGHDGVHEGWRDGTKYEWLSTAQPVGEHKSFGPVEWKYTAPAVDDEKHVHAVTCLRHGQEFWGDWDWVAGAANDHVKSMEHNNMLMRWSPDVPGRQEPGAPVVPVAGVG